MKAPKRSVLPALPRLHATGRSSLLGSLAAGRSQPVPARTPCGQCSGAPGQQWLWLFHLSEMQEGRACSSQQESLTP